MASRPLGDTIVGIIAIPLGLWSLFIGGIFGLLGGLAGLAAIAQGLIALIVGVGFFVAAYGIFTSQPWYSKVGIAVFGIDFIRRVVTFAGDGPTFVAVSGLFTIASGASVVYLVYTSDII